LEWLRHNDVTTHLLRPIAPTLKGDPGRYAGAEGHLCPLVTLLDLHSLGGLAAACGRW